jgi:hypothetical protein
MGSSLGLKDMSDYLASYGQNFDTPGAQSRKAGKLSAQPHRRQVKYQRKYPFVGHRAGTKQPLSSKQD